MPKSCWECIFADNQKGYCDLLETRILRHFTRRAFGCPLKSLADYTKQVRKKVCEEIREYLKNHKCKVIGDYNHFTLNHDEIDVCELSEINKFLDQLQGETNDSL